RYKAGNINAVVPGLPDADRARIANMIVQAKTDDGGERLSAWFDAAERGAFSFGGATPSYVKSGPGSWKEAALGVSTAKIAAKTQFEYSPVFMTSNWKLFH